MQRRSKIESLVTYPLRGLDLSTYVKGQPADSAPVLYDLYAVSRHSGSLSGGHYTAIALNEANGRFYEFNDSSVYEAQSDELVSAEAYILFYVRQGLSVDAAAARSLGASPSLVDSDHDIAGRTQGVNIHG